MKTFLKDHTFSDQVGFSLEVLDALLERGHEKFLQPMIWEQIPNLLSMIPSSSTAHDHAKHILTTYFSSDSEHKDAISEADDILTQLNTVS